LSCERTLNADVTKLFEIEANLRASADTLARRLRRHGLGARGVRVKLKTNPDCPDRRCGRSARGWR
jgi:nucleotidyltransferase/DNA polymerase involved in DNA repair